MHTCKLPFRAVSVSCFLKDCYQSVSLYTTNTHFDTCIYHTYVAGMKQYVPKLSLPVHSSVPHWKKNNIALN